MPEHTAQHLYKPCIQHARVYAKKWPMTSQAPFRQRRLVRERKHPLMQASFAHLTLACCTPLTIWGWTHGGSVPWGFCTGACRIEGCSTALYSKLRTTQRNHTRFTSIKPAVSVPHFLALHYPPVLVAHTGPSVSHKQHCILTNVPYSAVNPGYNDTDTLLALCSQVESAFVNFNSLYKASRCITQRASSDNIQCHDERRLLSFHSNISTHTLCHRDTLNEYRRHNSCFLWSGHDEWVGLTCQEEEEQIKAAVVEVIRQPAMLVATACGTANSYHHSTCTTPASVMEISGP